MSRTFILHTPLEDDLLKFRRMDGNEAIYKRVLDDEDFQKALMDLYALRLYDRLRMSA